MKSLQIVLTFLCFLLTATGMNAQNPEIGQQHWFTTRQLVGSQYEHLEPYSDQIAKVRRNGLYGLIDRQGKIVQAPEYQFIGPLTGSVSMVKKGGRYGAFNPSGALIIPAAFDEVLNFPLGDGLTAVRRDSLFAIFDENGSQRTAFQFRSVEHIVHGKIVAATGLDAVGAWDKQGHQLVPEEYHTLRPLPAGYWEGCRFEQCGLLGPDGALRTELRYHQLLAWPDGRYLASESRENYFFWYDAKGQKLKDKSFWMYENQNEPDFRYVISPEGINLALNWWGDTLALPAYTELRRQAGAPDSWLKLVQQEGEDSDGLEGWLDLETNIVVPPRYQTVLFKNGKIFASDSEYSFVLDRQNKLLQSLPMSIELMPGSVSWAFQTHAAGSYTGGGIIDTNFKQLFFSETIALTAAAWGGFVAQFSQGQCFSPQGKPLFSEKYDWVSPDRWSNQYFLIAKQGKVGLATISGKVLIEPRYERLEGLPGGGFMAVLNRRTGLVDPSGKVLIPFEYDRLEAWPNDRLILWQKDKCGLARTSDGKILLPVTYDKIAPFRENSLLSFRNQRYGIYTHDGTPVLPEAYQTMTNHTYPLLERDGKWGWSDDQLNEILPLEYDAISWQNGICESRKGTRIERWMLAGKRAVPTNLEAKISAGRWDARAYWGLLQNKWGLFRASSQPLLPAECDQFKMIEYAGIVAVVRMGRQAKILDANLQVIGQFEADSFRISQHDYLHYTLNGRDYIRNLSAGSSLPFDGASFHLYQGTDVVAVDSNAQVWLFDAQLEKPIARNLADFPELISLDRAYFIATQNGKKGLLDQSGKIILPFEYDLIHSGSDGYPTPHFLLTKGRNQGYYNSASGHFFPAKYPAFEIMDSLGFVEATRDDGKQALFAPDGKQITDFELEYVYRFGPNLFVADKNGKKGILDNTGKLIHPFDLTDVRTSENYAVLVKDQQQGLLLDNGTLLLPIHFNYIEGAGKLAFKARKPDNAQLLYDRAGRVVAGPGNFDIQTLTDSCFRLSKDGQMAILRIDGSFVLPYSERSIHFQNGLCIVEEPGKWGLIRPDGTPVLPFKYDLIAFAHDNSENAPILLGQQGKYGYLDLQGRPLTALEYDYADAFAYGLAAVRKKDKWGFVDTSGHLVIPLQFRYAENFDFEKQETVVLSDRGYVLIDREGKITRDFPFDTPGAAAYFHRHLERDCHPGSGCSVKESYYGRTLLHTPNLRIWDLGAGLIFVAKDSPDDCTYPPYGILDYAGGEVTGRIYGDINTTHLRECYLFPAYRDKKWGFLDGRGKIAVPFEYGKAWNIYQPYSTGVWQGRVHRDGNSWVVDRSGKVLRKE